MLPREGWALASDKNAAQSITVSEHGLMVRELKKSILDLYFKRSVRKDKVKGKKPKCIAIVLDELMALAMWLRGVSQAGSSSTK